MKIFKHLHHYSRLNAVQFVTFRTQDSLDAYLNQLIGSDLEMSKKQWRIDQYLDKSREGAYLYGNMICLLAAYLKSLESNFYDLIAFSIMPNHVHLLFTQKTGLSCLMQKLKGESAILLNQVLGRQGKFWQKDYYDKQIRDERHYCIAYEYIKNNALKAGLKDADKRFYGIHEEPQL
ncbi:transposase [Methylobacter sp. Wu8]|uniref:transposase n=1 Tax=Methylobacter sp. Wu8 TaxID=3118457 RepID=UPI002F2C654B